MAALKQLTTRDVTITPFDANKGFQLIGTAITSSDVGIEVYRGVNTDPSQFISSSATPTGFVYIQNVTGVYNSAKQLYYTNYLSSSKGDNVPLPEIIPGVNPEDDRLVGSLRAPRFDNYLQSSLTQSRYFPTGSNEQISLVSIPAKLFGENIVPYTFDMTYTSSDGYGFNVIDDGEGNIVINTTSSSAPDNIGDVVGQIFYSHGVSVFTTGTLALIGKDMGVSVSNLDNLEINFSSSLRIYEHQYKCTINENEFGYSLNPTLLSGSLDDVYYNFVTGSSFTPYITTVGLYNERNELLVVGKLSNPIPISQYTDTTIIINFDT